MSVIDSAREFVRIGTTAGLSKDVVDLLEKKAALLADEIRELESENATLRTKVTNLEAENVQLRAKLPGLQPKMELAKETAEALKLFFERQDYATVNDVAQRLKVEISVAEYHLDELWKLKFITPVALTNPARYAISTKGREFVMKNLR